ncbi:hypothetical protein CYLTODRAFT_426644 [Cylindrobasidium torrendii FP15055 ss-10]|uniref:F-box domain-containing protein n=1 Tax=Cylindrobasidium torrendii FP15055 ss-10 TaxID=1314674 RepID=A0A0D7AY41_9AGAR|nr:hypothetical protein CYLTODRAFT_426644 [Cylindrobasidium torrendii FP15055 ss-10]
MPTTTPPQHATFPPWSQSPDSVHPIFGDARLGIVPFARGDEPKDDPERESLMKELVSDLQVATVELDAQANALHHALQHINDQRKRCKKLLGQRNNINCPVLWVTDDVLSIIFDFCIDTSPWARDMAVDSTLLTLSHVCESGRKMLINSSAYWKNTGVTLQTDPQHDVPLPLLNMFLERVGPHPFPVRVVPRKLDDNHSTAFGNSVHLWRTLELVQYNGALERSLGYFGFPRLAGALEKLDFLLITDEDGDMTRFFQPFEQCQNLRDLKIRVVFYMPRLAKLSVPSPNLVLWAVRCPALEVLELGCLADCAPIDVFLAQSRPPLRILRIETDRRIVNKLGDGINELCSHFPSIDTVAFISYDPQSELPIFLLPERALRLYYPTASTFTWMCM